jgi:transcriptional regulator with XRE-family HTH domain
MSAKHKNLVGPQVRKLRYQRGWKQKDLAARLQILGWDIDRASVSKIESQLVWVGDFEMFYLAEALRVDLKQLFPAFDPAVALHDNIVRLRRKK